MREPTAAELWQTPRSGASAPRLTHQVGWWEWSERALLVVLIVIFVVTGFVPAWRHLNSDFPNYYLIARLYRKGFPLERVYEWTWLQRQKDHQGIDQPLVSFIPSTLPSALVVLPLSSLPPLVAKRWWLGINLAFLLVTAGVLRSITKLSALRIALLIFLAIVPLRDSFLYGQMHILVLLLLTIAACLYFRDYFFLSGIVLAVAATLKIYPALFLIFLVFKKQWRAAIGLVVGLTSAYLISLYLFGRNASLTFFEEVLPRGLRGETIDPYSVAWNSLSALLRRLFIAEPELNPSPVVHAPALYAFLHPLIHGFIFVAFMWVIGTKTGECDRKKVEWAAYLFILLLLSSQPGPYHFVALIITTVLVIDYLVSCQQMVKAGLVAALYALICSPLGRLSRVSALGWSNLVFFPRLALMMLLGGVLLWLLASASPEWGSRLNLRTSLLAAFALAALVAGGFISNTRHLKGQFDNYKTRLVTIPDSLFASDPVAISRGVWFNAMGTRGYVIRALRDGSVREVPEISGDWFHPAAGVQSDESWAERSSGKGSGIVRFPAEDSTQNPTSQSTEADNAQQPVVSLDGELLAFIREDNGRDSLWVQPIKNTQDKFQGVGAREVAGTGYDVREMSFVPDHRLVFSSRSNGRFTLYMIEQQGNIEKMRSPACSARYPAISPDGEWMAFSCEQAGSWQIHVMSLRTNEESQLTNSECNSISPAWTPDSKRLVYATDCGRGLGLTALAELTIFP